MSISAFTLRRGGATLRSKNYESGWWASTAYKNIISSASSRHYYSSSSSSSSSSLTQFRKSNTKRAFLVDTLGLIRGLEAQGIPTKQAEAITVAMTEVLNDSLESVSHNFVTKSDVQKSELVLDSNLSKFKAEVRSSEEHHLASLQREAVKLHADVEKIRSDIRYEIDKVAAGQRLDLNLEKGRIRDDLAKQNGETTLLSTKLDKEIHSLKAQLEGAKYDLIKYYIGTLVSISAVGIAVFRLLM